MSNSKAVVLIKNVTVFECVFDLRREMFVILENCSRDNVYVFAVAPDRPDSRHLRSGSKSPAESRHLE